MGRSVNILALPLEVVCECLHYLQVQDLLRCTEVNKYLRDAIRSSSSLQYMIELAFSRFQSITPNAHSGPPTYKRLETLRKRESNWRQLKWDGHHAVKLPCPGSVYEFVGGYYGNGREDESLVPGSLSFVQLPSSTFGGEECDAWSSPLEGLQIIDFTMDPSQDLLILVVISPAGSKNIYDLCIHSLATNEYHPLAHTPVFGSVPRTLLQDMNVTDVSATVRVQVSGSIVALLIKEVIDTVGAHLEIWNWKEGPQHSSMLTRMPGIDDFCFLSQNSFLIVRPSGKLEVCTFEDPAERSSTPVSRAIYSLPELSSGYLFWYISMSSNPAPGFIPSQDRSDVCACMKARREQEPEESSQILSRSDKAIQETCTHCPGYYPLPDERIHACCVYVFNPTPNPPAGHVHSFVFFVNVKTFLAYTTPVTPSQPHRSDETANDANVTSVSMTSTSLNQLMPQPSDESPYAPPQYEHVRPLTIPTFSWESWGPQNTRWFQERLSTDWQHGLFGYRTVETVPGPIPNNHEEDSDSETEVEAENYMLPRRPGPRRLRVRDFNPYSIRRHLSEENAKGADQHKKSVFDGHVVTEPSVTSTSGVFTKPIVSSLPYREVASREAFDVTDVMIDEARILLLKRADDGHLRSIEVLTM